jgi:uncharacterized protein (TIGR03083 family)
MSSVEASFEQHVETVSVEAERLGIVTIDALDRVVPSCPEWTGRELIDHLWHVQSFWLAQVLVADLSEAVEIGDRSLPTEGEPAEWLEQAAAELVDAMRSVGPEAPCWNWSGEDLTVGWVARRMALETAVHRYDGELAAESPTPIDTHLSADGIDEFLMVHLRTDLPAEPTATLGGTLCLACSDIEQAWTVEVGGGHLRVRNDRGPASACLRGTASDLFLFVWNRVSLDALELTGDRSVAAAWASLPH